MKKPLLTLCACFALSLSAHAVGCIPSGVTDQYTYFVAVDATDRISLETGLSAFTVYRSRNGGAAVAFTTPTINETDVTNMPGAYELLLDEDMTIDAGDDAQHMTVRITHAGMAPVTKEICISRPKITAGETLAVTGGVGNANTAQIAGAAVNPATAQIGVNVVNYGGAAGTFAGGRPEVNSSHWGGTAVGSANVRSNVIQYNGTNGTFAAGRPEVNATHWGGTAVATARPLVDMVLISGDAPAADTLEAALDLQGGGNGAFPWLGIHASGTAVAYSAGTPSITLASATDAPDDAFNCTSIAVRGATEGDWVTGTIADYAGASDVATLSAALPYSPTGGISYVVWGTACASGGGSGPTAVQIRQEIDTNSTQLAAILADSNELQNDWANGGRLDNILDARASQSSLDVVATNVNDVETDTADMQPKLGTFPDLGSGATLAGNLEDMRDNGTAAFDRATDSLQAIRDRGDAAWTGGGGGSSDWTVDERAAIAAILGIPPSGTTPADPTSGILDTTRDAIVALNDLSSAEAQSAAAAALSAYNPPTRAEMDAGLAALNDITAQEAAAAVTSAQGILTGICDSGSTTTCVDNALTQADATQLQGRLICYDDSWCALITTFAPASDTVTTTKTAPSTRASRAYSVFPSTLE